MTPAYKARLDWAILGEFRPDQFTGEDRKQYEDEAMNISKQWDNQESYQWP